MKHLHALFVGAHPDDIEIGAAALVQRAQSQATVHFLVLTDDAAIPSERRTEAVAAAGELGVEASRVYFAGLRDGRLRPDAKSVHKVRELLRAHRVSPRIVVVHSRTDSHNDHVAANGLMHAAIRQAVFLNYSVHISAEDSFAPRVFVELNPERRSRKASAVASHVSQKDRISKRSLDTAERRFGELAGLPSGEALELELQSGADEDALAASSSFNESTFHQFWQPQLPGGRLLLLYASHERPGAQIDWPTADENIGRDALREAFRSSWVPRSPLVEQASSEVEATTVLLGDTNILLAGGPVSNQIVRDVYNRLASVRWIVEYELPRHEPAFVVDRKTGQRLNPTVSAEGLLVLASVRNPYNLDRRLILVAGTSGVSTRRGLEMLAEPDQLLRLLRRPCGYDHEMLLEVGRDGAPRLIEAHV